MAQSATFPTQAADGGFLTRTFAGLGRALTFLAENNPRYQQIEALRMMSDADLSAKGLTRADAVRKIFSDRFYL